ncbi:MAG: peroxide stress protein YaaA [Candidatus Bathyarchaeia archaeon]
MKPSQLIHKVKEEKHSILLISACSWSKRRDNECEKIIQSFRFKICKDPRVYTDKFCELNLRFRRCTEKYHSTAVDKSSKPYPAFIRYSGYFYKAIEEKSLELWMEALKQGWNLLILSAFYGLLQVTEPIRYYNLQISQLNEDCQKILPEILNAYLEARPEIEKIIFLTSETYSRPFINKTIKPIYRLYLKDASGREILGDYGKDFYSLAGKIFANILSEKEIYSINDSVSAELLAR